MSCQNKGTACTSRSADLSSRGRCCVHPRRLMPLLRVACGEQLYHLGQVVALGESQRRDAVLVSRRNCGAGIQQDRGAFGTMVHRPSTVVAAAQRVQQRRSVLVSVIRVKSSSRKQQKQHVRLLEQV